MRPAILACLSAVVTLSLASCKCGDGAEQVQGPTGVPQPGRSGEEAAEPADPEKQVVCPVCGLRFGREEAAATQEHGGRTYYFLIEDHQQAFAADPESFLDDPAP